MIETAETVASRLGLPVEWTKQHTGEHICVDGRRYRDSCLATDPEMDEVIRRIIAPSTGFLSDYQPGGIVRYPDRTGAREVPAEWPPREGDVWQDNRGEQWTASTRNGFFRFRTRAGSSMAPDSVLEERSSLTLVSRQAVNA